MVALGNLAEAFQGTNPHVDTRFKCDATRVVPAGGALAGLLLHDSMIPFQMVFRIEPDAGIFRASIQRPINMTLGAFTVPAESGLALGEYRFRVYRLDGLIPGDAVPLEDRRLSLEIGNTVPISGSMQRGQISAQIIPGPLQPPQMTTFAGTVNGGTPVTSNVQGKLATLPGSIPSPYTVVAPANPAPPVSGGGPQVNPRQFVMSSSGGNALIPNSNDPTQGSERLPFTYYVREGTPISVLTTVFAPVRIPIAFFEATLSGFLMEQRTLDALIEQVRPCQGK